MPCCIRNENHLRKLNSEWPISWFETFWLTNVWLTTIISNYSQLFSYCMQWTGTVNVLISALVYQLQELFHIVYQHMHTNTALIGARSKVATQTVFLIFSISQYTDSMLLLSIISRFLIHIPSYIIRFVDLLLCCLISFWCLLLFKSLKMK